MPAEPLIEADGPRRRLRRRRRRSPGVDFSLRRGERLALLGPNGGGKTTLLRALLGELRPLGGTLRVGAALRHRAADRALAPRLPGLGPRRGDDGRALAPALVAAPGPRASARRRRGRSTRVGLGALAGETFGELSGGQRQRVLIARALVQDAGVLLLDEPFSGLDRPSAERLEALIARAGRRRGGRSSIATHDLEQARALGPRPLPQPAPDRRRPARPRPLDRGVLEATYGGAIVEIPGAGGRGDPAAPPSPPLTMLEPLQEAVHAARARRDRPDRRRRRRARLLGRPLRASPTRPSRSPTRSSPGWSLAALAGVPLLLGAAPAIVVAALAIALAARVAGVGRDAAVAVVVTTMFGLGVLLALSPRLAAGDRVAALRRRPRRHRRRPGCRRRRSPCSSPSALRLLHGRLLVAGFDRGAARALGVSPALADAALLLLLAAAIVVAVQGLGNLLVVAVFVGPAAAARRLTDRMRADDGSRRGARRPRRRRRPLPLLLRGHGRRRLDGAGDRRRLPALRAAGGCARCGARRAPRLGLRSAECRPGPTAPGPSTPSPPCRRRATAAAAPAPRWSRRWPATTAPSPRSSSTTSCAGASPRSAAPASTGRSSSSSSSAWCSGSR